jgi:hypothetical protein
LNPIRPNYPLPVAQPRPVRPEARAAQRAFFEAAVNRAAATAPAASAASAGPVDPVRPAAAASRTVRDETQPQRYLRPGSLLDIKV